MKKTISILIPSKSNPEKAAFTVFNLVGLAEYPQLLEFIMIVNKDESKIDSYQHLRTLLAQLGISVLIHHSNRSGYLSIPHFYNEGWSISSGGFILLYNDDVKISTVHWDTIYIDSLINIPFGVASSFVDERPNLTAYQWAFPVIKREICDRLGAVCIFPDIGACDRVYDAYAQISGRGVRAPVNIRHFFDVNLAGAGGERKQFYDSLNQNWNIHCREWERCALAIVAKTRLA